MINIDYKGHPKKPFKQLLHDYSSKYLVLDDVLADEDTYAYIYQDILDILKYGLEFKMVREMPISFIIHHGDSTKPEDLKQLEVRHFLSNMVMWYAYMKMECVDIMDDSFIIDWKDKDVNFIGDWIDERIIPYHHGDFHELNTIVDEIVFHIKAISDAFCLIFGYSASIYDIMQAERDNPEIHDILYGEIDPTLQPKELEDKLNDLNKKLIKAFGESDSDLRPLLKAGKNISANQFREIFLRIGFKADISNRTIPWFIDSNLLISGINTPAAFYILAESGRKALMDMKLSMSKPGALSKKMNHNTTPIVLRHDHEHCDSTRPIYYYIEDEDFLRLLDKRYYYDEDGSLKLLDYKRDKHMIGHTYGFRSPCTCTSKEGICELCYGDLFDMNSDLFSQGAFAALVISEPSGQLILKSKHEQHTSSDEIDFAEDFYKTFDVVSTEVTLGDNIDDGLMIKLGPVQTEDTDDGEVYYVQYFDLIDFNGEIKAHVQEEHGFSLYLAPETVSAWKQMKEKPIPLDRFDEDDDNTVLFNIEIKSKAITQGLQSMLAALDSKDHLGCSHDLDGLCQKFGRILIDAGIKYNFVHGEMLIRALLRKSDDDTQFPDFGPNGDHEDYTILRLTSSLSRSPSPIIRLSTGWLKKGLISTALYKAHAPSHFDPLFVPVLADVIDQD